MPRPIDRRYEDPLDALWLACARGVGLSVTRAPDAYASTDGHGTLLLSDAAGMDADDCLSQMILHELCHSLVQGRQSFAWIDWGLDNEGERDVALEQACLRLQAALLEPLGLRQVFAPTTDFRAFYDALPADPFEERAEQDRESIVRARAAFARREQRPWGPHLQVALEATASIVALTRSHASGDSLWSAAVSRSALHRVGLPLHAASSATCGDCAWLTSGSRCRVAAKPTRAAEPACERFEAALDCLSCGACCREAYDVVAVKKNDPAAKLHLDLLVPTATGFDLLRHDGRCNALRGGEALRELSPAIVSAAGAPPNDTRQLPRYLPSATPFTCTIYETRPQTCRDFTRGSQNCLDARRAVGLSR